MPTLLKEYAVFLLISDKAFFFFFPGMVFFQTESLARVKEDSFIMVKWSISQKHIKIINQCAPNIENSKYIKTDRSISNYKIQM